jgi:hypothetical protein
MISYLSDCIHPVPVAENPSFGHSAMYLGEVL